jgi:hypothetical protein
MQRSLGRIAVEVCQGGWGKSWWNSLLLLILRVLENFQASADEAVRG